MATQMAIDLHANLADVVSDEDRFRAWYDAALPRVYRYLAARCGGDEALAEDLTQQTFTEAIRARHRFDGRSDAVTWLCAIGRNRLIDHYRREERALRRHGALVARVKAGGDEEDAWARRETRHAIAAALAELPADQRLALLFRYLDDMPVRDVGAALGRSEKAAESLLTRAREGFRRTYGGDR